MSFFSFLLNRPKLSLKEIEELEDLRKKKYLEMKKKQIEVEFR